MSVFIPWWHKTWLIVTDWPKVITSWSSCFHLESTQLMTHTFVSKCPFQNWLKWHQVKITARFQDYTTFKYRFEPLVAYWIRKYIERLTDWVLSPYFHYFTDPRSTTLYFHDNFNLCLKTVALVISVQKCFYVGIGHEKAVPAGGDIFCNGFSLIFSSLCLSLKHPGAGTSAIFGYIRYLSLINFTVFLLRQYK